METFFIKIFLQELVEFFFFTKIFLHFFISIVTKNMSVSWQSAVSGNPKILDICFVRQKFIL